MLIETIVATLICYGDSIHREHCYQLNILNYNMSLLIITSLFINNRNWKVWASWGKGDKFDLNLELLLSELPCYVLNVLLVCSLGKQLLTRVSTMFSIHVLPCSHQPSNQDFVSPIIFVHPILMIGNKGFSFKYPLSFHDVYAVNLFCWFIHLVSPKNPFCSLHLILMWSILSFLMWVGLSVEIEKKKMSWTWALVCLRLYFVNPFKFNYIISLHK